MSNMTPDGETCRWDPPDSLYGQSAALGRALDEAWTASGIPPVLHRIVVALVRAIERIRTWRV